MHEIVRAFNHLIDQGKAFYWGTSEWSAQQIEEAHGVAHQLGLIAPICDQAQCESGSQAQSCRPLCVVLRHLPFRLGSAPRARRG
jgi:aryl-alcohol dehydrogenase-like predicted oxidoreductase